MKYSETQSLELPIGVLSISLIKMSLDPNLMDHTHRLPEGPYGDKETKVLFEVLF
jgi:hypothetical protein